jgi:Tol biopolymer transport system component
VRTTSDGFAPATLWIAGPDGGQARPLVDDRRFLAVWAPRFSPDGRHVLFTAYSPNPADRARPRLKVAPPGASGERWPPAVAAHGYPMDFWLVEVATGKLELLAALAGDDLFGAWAPDGQRLAYVTLGGLFVLDLATGVATSLATVPAYGGLDWAGP